MQALFELVIAIVLCAVSLHAGYWWWYFRKATQDIGLAVSYMAFGEFFAIAMTCAFGACAYFEVLQYLPWWLQGTMRMSMAAVAFRSTHKLAEATRKAEGR